MYSLGEESAINDSIIEKNLQNLIKKEDEIIQQYKTLKSLEDYCPNDNKTQFMKLLESRKLFLEYKQQTKKEQIKSLYKLLEYLNTLEDKKQQYDTELILNQINQLQMNLNNYN
tara:strand:+ start:472 stop:813 length:342 start_codon:yes stop_codon:yes gene_type:complete